MYNCMDYFVDIIKMQYRILHKVLYTEQHYNARGKCFSIERNSLRK